MENLRSLVISLQSVLQTLPTIKVSTNMLSTSRVVDMHRLELPPINMLKGQPHRTCDMTIMSVRFQKISQIIYQECNCTNS